MSAEDWKDVARAVSSCGVPHLRLDAEDALERLGMQCAIDRERAKEAEKYQAANLERIERLAAETAAMRDVLEQLRDGFSQMVETGAWHPDAAIGPVRAIDAALSWGGANTGETQALAGKAGKP